MNVLTFAIIYTIGAFSIFWLLYYLGRKGLRKHFQSQLSFNFIFVLYFRLIGIVLFGIFIIALAWIFFAKDWQNLGIFLDKPETTFWWCLASVFVLLPVNIYITKAPSTQKVYPQMRLINWDRKLFFINALTWTLYLAAYEFLFRGVLFFSAIKFLDLWPAILLNVLLYSLVHIPKGYREMVGAVPFGILLCLGSYFTGSFWFAFFAHTLQAVSTEYFAIQSNPEMAFSGEGESIRNLVD